MSWNGQDHVDARVLERGFTLACEGRQVPGVYWTPVGRDASGLVLLGHGGTADKKVDYIMGIARGLAGRGIASVAIDGPGHGERPGADQWEAGLTQFGERWASGGGTEGMVADWRAALDFIEDQDEVRPTGFLGLSMGTMMGLPVCVADERIGVAVLGLMGLWGPNATDLERLAPDLSIPLRFLVQWDDEVVPRQRCFELFGAMGSGRKSMHVNPGVHAAVPAFEIEAAVEYLAAQLAKI